MNSKLIIFFMFCVLMIPIKAHDCPREKGNGENKTVFDLDYKINNAENKEIIEECKERAKYLALTESLQNFLEHINILEKYNSDRVSYPTNQTLMLLILEDSPISDLLDLRDYWIKKMKKDHLIRSQDHLANHILVKYLDVIKFIEEKFEKCKNILTKIEDKKTYEDTLKKFGKKDYPALTSWCIFCFDGKFKNGKLNEHVLGAVLFERLEKEFRYFGQRPREEAEIQEDG